MERNFNLSENDLNLFLSSSNSYLGMMKQYNTYRLREKILTQKLSSDFLNYVHFFDDYAKIIVNEKEK
jgi:hypothetical protein